MEMENNKNTAQHVQFVESHVCVCVCECVCVEYLAIAMAAEKCGEGE